MKTHIKKLSKTLLFGLVILLIITAIYLAIPKYQIHSVRINDDYVLITKINTISGEITTNYKRYTTYTGPKIKKLSPIR